MGEVPVPPKSESEAINDAALVEALAAQGDWAVLVRYWIGRDYVPAFSHAIAILQNAAAGGSESHAIVGAWLVNAPLVATGPLLLDPKLLEFMTEQEAVTLQLRSLHSMSMLWAVIDSAPPDQRDNVLEASIAATLSMMDGAGQIGDELLVAFLHDRWMSVLKLFTDKAAADAVFSRIVDDYRAKMVARPEIMRSHFLRVLYMLAESQGELPGLLNTFREILENHRLLPAESRGTVKSAEDSILLRLGAALRLYVVEGEAAALPSLGEMTEIPEWAKLCRHWIRSGDNSARDRALSQLRTIKAESAELTAAIADWIERVPEQDSKAQPIPQTWNTELPLGEYATLVLLAHKPVHALCSEENGYSSGDFVSILPTAIALAREEQNLARELGDGLFFLWATINLAGYLLRFAESRRAEENAESASTIAQSITVWWQSDGSHRKSAVTDLGAPLSRAYLLPSKSAAQARLTLLEEALEPCRLTQDFGDLDPLNKLRALILFSIGEVMMESNEPSQACEKVSEGLRAFEKEFGLPEMPVEPASIAVCLNHLASVQWIARLRESARDHTEHALAILRPVCVQEPEKYLGDLAACILTLADIYGKQFGNRSGLECLGEAVEVITCLAQTKSPAHLRRIADHEKLMSGFVEVSKAIKRALAGEFSDRFSFLSEDKEGRRLFEENLLFTTGRTICRGVLEGLAVSSSDKQVAMRKQAHLYLARQARFHAGNNGSEEAYERLWVACRLIEALRTKLNDESERHRVLVENASAFELHVHNCFDRWMGKNPPDGSLLREATWAVEASRSRQLLERLSAAEITPARLTPEIKAQLLEFDQKIELARRRRESAINGDADNPEQSLPARAFRIAPTAIPTHTTESERMARAEIASFEQSKAELIERLRKDDPDITPEPMLGAKEFDLILGTILCDLPTTVFVEYMLGAEASFALLLGQNGFFAVKLPAMLNQDAQELAAQWREGYESAKREFDPKDKRVGFRSFVQIWTNTQSKLLAALFSSAIAPVLQAITDRKLLCERLVISPHRDLHMFPFHACCLPDGRVLGEAVEVSYTPSLAMLYRCTERKREGERRLVQIDEPARFQADERLIFCEAETKGIQSHLKGVLTATPLSAEDATRDAFIAAAESARVLHYSGHAAFDAADPLQSRLELSGAWLTLAEVFSKVILRNNALTVLNGCESGLLRPDAVDDYVSFTTGFLFAGAPCVVTTLWLVPDLPSALIMDEFYAQWVAGATPAAALRDAQKKVRELRKGAELEAAVDRLTVALGSDEAKEGRRRDAHQYVEDFCSGAEQPFADPVHWAAFTCNGLGFRRLE